MTRARGGKLKKGQKSAKVRLKYQRNNDEESTDEVDGDALM